MRSQASLVTGGVPGVRHGAVADKGRSLIWRSYSAAFLASLQIRRQSEQYTEFVVLSHSDSYNSVFLKLNRNYATRKTSIVTECFSQRSGVEQQGSYQNFARTIPTVALNFCWLQTLQLKRLGHLISLFNKNWTQGPLTSHSSFQAMRISSGQTPQWSMT